MTAKKKKTKKKKVPKVDVAICTFFTVFMLMSMIMLFHVLAEAIYGPPYDSCIIRRGQEAVANCPHCDCPPRIELEFNKAGHLYNRIVHKCEDGVHVRMGSYYGSDLVKRWDGWVAEEERSRIKPRGNYDNFED